MIYLRLRGRIGNQLFMYAYARSMQIDRNNREKIIVDDSEVVGMNWLDALKCYNLPNVEFKSKKHTFIKSMTLKQKVNYIIYRHCIKGKTFNEKYEFEKNNKEQYNKIGLYLCENGYLQMEMSESENCFIEGYFQSEKYFAKHADIILNEIDLTKMAMNSGFHELDKLRQRNSVCISIKVEHNVGSRLYDVCSKEYWEKAIQMIVEKIENPLFFICSDNVNYVKENLIDCEKYDVILQDASLPVYISLQIMSMCKHFIIGNTSYGWWAQYLSEYKEKMVIAPSKWMLVDMPIDIYEDNWTLIEV